MNTKESKDKKRLTYYKYQVQKQATLKTLLKWT